MTDVLAYRGPDSSGYELHTLRNCQVGLGHRRLSILDLSELGRQPMRFEHLHITYNGEVYNFKEVREALREFDYHFTSDTDTEVILKAFHHWGVECIHRFRGMFAFAIFDEREQKVYLFRDRAGVKPLYYHSTEGLFLFTSELKALHPHPSFTGAINTDVIPTYMQFGYIPAPYSIFRNTHKLKPGHYLTYSLTDGSFRIEKYWDVTDHYRKAKLRGSEEELVGELEALLLDAFRLRMVSDVPVGVFLSGGIDSSVVAALLQKDSSEPLKTFTIGFDEDGYNEAEHAKKIAEYLGTDHTELYCTREDALNIIPELPKIYDEPFGDSSAIATILVSRLARENVSVVLSGDGGDETFCGYSKYFALQKTLHLLHPGLRRNLVRKVINTLNAESVHTLNTWLPASLRQTNIRDKFQKFKRSINTETLEAMFVEASSYVSPKNVGYYTWTEATTLPGTNFDNFKNLGKISTLEKMMAIDYQTFMTDDVLTKVDRATMSISLEGREPLLDHKIIEFAARIPDTMKYRKGAGKYLLRKVLYNHIPSSFYDRQKAGFQVPLFEWLKSDLKPLLDRYLDHDRLREGGIFDADAIQETLRKYETGAYVNINELWFILMFEMWREQWVH